MIPVKATRATATLPKQDSISFSTRNMIDGDPATVWAAPFQLKSLFVEMKVEAYAVSALHILNGNRRDRDSFENNSRARTVKIFVNNRDNLVKTDTLKDLTWEENVSDEIVFKPMLKDVKILIVQIESIYPGKKWNDLMISEISLEGYEKQPLKEGIVPVASSFVDARDGQSYRTLKLGNVNWMAQNLNYADEGSSCYESKVGVRCSEKGRVYGESGVDDGLCPLGWRLPTKEEYLELGRQVRELSADSAVAFFDLFDSDKSLNSLGLGFAYMDSLCMSADDSLSAGETALWVRPYQVENDEEVSFVRFGAKSGAYVPSGEQLFCFRNGGPEYRKEFFVRCVEEQ